MYSIVRMYQQETRSNRVILSGLTLAQAQEHCRDPETSSSTATSSEGTKRTATYGPWFDGYQGDS
jgi:hypothetical protein